MKNVEVFYPKKNFTAFSFNFDGKLLEYDYDDEGNFNQRSEVEPSLEMYEKVSETEWEDERTNEELFKWVITSHNVGTFPKKISDKIRSGELNVGHSSFSVGDVIKIEGSYYISNGMDFEMLPLEFSGDA